MTASRRGDVQTHKKSSSSREAATTKVLITKSDEWKGKKKMSVKDLRREQKKRFPITGKFAWACLGKAR